MFAGGRDSSALVPNCPDILAPIS